ncbi:DUF4260 domain-containing protein [Mesorhizobium sp. SB112]|uniref:DUF4260 domain-containing protein n=1 Tax=Mesorhizobium sp. SB112 TaxID=3151853 RepID=UPI00326701F5
MSGYVTGTPKLLLRLEGLCVLAVATAAYQQQSLSWWVFAVLFLAPDLSMSGYLAGRKVGAAVYNAGHSYALPLACIAWGASEPRQMVLAVGLIWAAHIGFDRALGYGLKYSSGFGVSHLGLIGTAKRERGSER